MTSKSEHFFETSFYLSFEDSKKKGLRISKNHKNHKRMAGDAFSYMEKTHRYLVSSQQTLGPGFFWVPKMMTPWAKKKMAETKMGVLYPKMDGL